MSTTAKHPILLVDDEPEMLFSLKGLLRREFELFTAESGRQALEVLRQHEIHVIVTDQRMPEMTGVELIERVRAEYPDAIRIVFTGYADLRAVVDGINRGGLHRYITKPWDPDEFVTMLHEVAAEYEAAVERKRLLGDLREHLKQELAVVERSECADGPPADANGGLQGLATDAKRLLARLDAARQPARNSRQGTA